MEWPRSIPERGPTTSRNKPNSPRIQRPEIHWDVKWIRNLRVSIVEPIEQLKNWMFDKQNDYKWRFYPAKAEISTREMDILKYVYTYIYYTYINIIRKDRVFSWPNLPSGKSHTSMDPSEWKWHQPNPGKAVEKWPRKPGKELWLVN